MFSELGWQGQAALAVAKTGEPFGAATDFDLPGVSENGLVEDWIEVRSWVFVETRYLPGGGDRIQGRTHFHDTRQTLTAVAERLRDRGCVRRIGIERGSLHVKVLDGLADAFPNAELVDVERPLDQLRYRKTPYEIASLRHAADAQWRVIGEVMSEVRVGITHRDIVHAIRERAHRIEGIDSVRFIGCYMGQRFSPAAWHYDAQAKAGDFITFDVGFSCRGYVSDSARTFVLGEPSEEQLRIEAIFKTAHDEALSLYRPGETIAAVFRRAIDVVRDLGLPHYERGHVGHGLGLSDYIEEWPWVNAENDMPFEPDTVFTLEIPYYAHVFGTYMDEDIIRITDSGHELLTTMSRGIHRVG
jgi:Xaa-Pro aminopeptidase